MPAPELESFAARWEEFVRLERLVNHWRWRPDWSVGRSFYTWSLTFDDATAVLLHDLVARLQDGPVGVGSLEPIPHRWLHLTMQGLGFTDEVSDDDVDAIPRAATKRLATVPAFDLSLGLIEADDEATGLLVRPWSAVSAVRDNIQVDVVDVVDVWDEVPERPEFYPHVSIAYSNADFPIGRIREQVALLRDLDSVAIPITTVQLIRLNRDNQMYEWEVVADVPLGSR
ncbi:2'-5' RNA ligase superfamily protein [Promicromonospora umidemergens]|uniref:2'-5' RNA ligase superfamily protein n=1 Tax=Promicromonospora umidemergens TaxID=629679 RepID=A0ABP8XST9_9MICO|nr:2'-5' RNA ligase family protein [Promicromonospora umidemergens]MCP2285156.1 2'-5' RNA ligase superfamily protein [Promicromonospora umidemergens]